MSVAVLVTFFKANESIILALLLALSEYLGANPKVKSNGIVSLVLIQVQSLLRRKGARDLTP